MYSVILAGGSGTRLFPLSRSDYPKQFIPLLGNESLFQKTVKRTSLFSSPEEIFIVTNEAHKFLVQDQLSEIEIMGTVLTEPCGKNTLPAILYAVQEIAKKDPSAKIAVFSSDQLVESGDAYKAAISSAEKLAEKYLVVFGIVPDNPDTGFGYIKPGTKMENGFLVEKFVEKPDLKTAERYITQNYLWNSGMFCFSADIFLSECKKYSSDVYEAFTHPIKEAFQITPKVSVDYGIMEKTDIAAVVPLSSSWNDLGSFSSLYSVSKKNPDGNVVEGEYISPDGKNNLIISEKLVSTIGLSDIAVVDTTDVLMICPKDQSQRVGEIASLLQSLGDSRAVLHTTVHRPWGSYTILLRGKSYLIKRLTVHPRSRLSLQSHKFRSEHWIVVRGTAEVVNDENTFTVNSGESTFVPSGAKHRLSNLTDEPLEVIEVQLGEQLLETDIERYDDDYHR